jgi:hypothetical protein
MVENTKEVNGIEYLLGSLTAKKQLHVSRRVAPVLASALTNLAGAPAGLTMDQILLTAARPIADTLSKMTDEDVDYVVDTCLAVCKRKATERGGWVNVMNAAGGIQFADMQMDALLALTAAVIEKDIMPFFPIGRLQSQPETVSQDSSQ